MKKIILGLSMIFLVVIMPVPIVEAYHSSIHYTLIFDSNYWYYFKNAYQRTGYEHKIFKSLPNNYLENNDQLDKNHIWQYNYVVCEISLDDSQTCMSLNHTGIRDLNIFGWTYVGLQSQDYRCRQIQGKLKILESANASERIKMPTLNRFEKDCKYWNYNINRDW